MLRPRVALGAASRRQAIIVEDERRTYRRSEAQPEARELGLATLKVISQVDENRRHPRPLRERSPVAVGVRVERRATRVVEELEADAMRVVQPRPRSQPPPHLVD